MLLGKYEGRLDVGQGRQCELSSARPFPLPHVVTEPVGRWSGPGTKPEDKYLLHSPIEVIDRCHVGGGRGRAPVLAEGIGAVFGAVRARAAVLREAVPSNERLGVARGWAGDDVRDIRPAGTSAGCPARGGGGVLFGEENG